MPATNQDITHWAGDSATISILVLDVDGNKVDLSGATARWWMAKGVGATGMDIYVKKSTDSGGGIVITLGTDVDTVVITLDPADTGTLTKFGNLYHECEVIDSSGDVSTVTVGKFILKQALIPTP